MSRNNKYIRIELMVEEEDKPLDEEAALSKGLTLNRYIIDAAMRAAKEDRAKEEQLVLSSSDHLEKTPEPNTA